MRNPFKIYSQDRDEFDSLLSELYVQCFLLKEEVQNIREELDFFIDALDD
jgi:hypothetical protein